VRAARRCSQVALPALSCCRHRDALRSCGGEARACAGGGQSYRTGCRPTLAPLTPSSNRPELLWSTVGGAT
jgi:hypothetical protein